MNKVLIMAMVAAVTAGPALARGSMDQGSQSMRSQQQGMMDQGQQGQQSQQQAMTHDRDTVRQVQQQLNQQGYKVSVDGVWGRNTQQALRQYQQDKGISGNGQLNNDTLAALGVEAGGQQTQQAQTPQQRQQSRQPGVMDQQQQRQQPRGSMGSESQD